jgi:hypothetical protein
MGPGGVPFRFLADDATLFRAWAIFHERFKLDRTGPTFRLAYPAHVVEPRSLQLPASRSAPAARGTSFLSGSASPHLRACQRRWRAPRRPSLEFLAHGKSCSSSAMRVESEALSFLNSNRIVHGRWRRDGPRQQAPILVGPDETAKLFRDSPRKWPTSRPTRRFCHLASGTVPAIDSLADPYGRRVRCSAAN